MSVLAKDLLDLKDSDQDVIYVNHLAAVSTSTTLVGINNGFHLSCEKPDAVVQLRS